MLRNHPLAEEGPHLASEALQEEGVGLSRETVDGYGLQLGPLGVAVLVVGEPGQVALLPPAGRAHEDEAAAPQFGPQLLDLVAQGHQDVELLVVLAHILDQLVQEVLASRRTPPRHFHLHRGRVRLPFPSFYHLLIMRQNSSASPSPLLQSISFLAKIISLPSWVQRTDKYF